MRIEVRDKLNAWAYQTKALADELRNDPATDAQFVQRQIMGAYGRVDMEVCSQFGIHLNPVATVVDPPEPAEPTPAKPKKAKK